MNLIDSWGRIEEKFNSEKHKVELAKLDQSKLRISQVVGMQAVYAASGINFGHLEAKPQKL